MKELYQNLQKAFEKVTAAGTIILSSSITFAIVLAVMIFWFLNRDFKTLETNEVIRDCIHAITFLSLFIIQREFNHFSGSIQVKLDELIVSYKPANNAIVSVEKKTEQEIEEIKGTYIELAKEKNNS